MNLFTFFNFKYLQAEGKRGLPVNFHHGSILPCIHLSIHRDTYRGKGRWGLSIHLHQRSVLQSIYLFIYSSISKRYAQAEGEEGVVYTPPPQICSSVNLFIYLCSIHLFQWDTYRGRGWRGLPVNFHYRSILQCSYLSLEFQHLT